MKPRIIQTWFYAGGIEYVVRGWFSGAVISGRNDLVESVTVTMDGVEVPEDAWTSLGIVEEDVCDRIREEGRRADDARYAV